MLKIIKYAILLFLILVFVFTVLLFSGIKINSFSLGKFSVSQLYLKLDKKLIVEIEDLVFEVGRTKNKEMSSSDIQDIFLKIPKVLDIFEKIDIERLKVKNNEFTILINDREVYIDNKDVNLSANLDFNASQMTFKIYSIFLKEYELTLWGEGQVNIAKNTFNFFGNYDYSYVTGELNIHSNKQLLDFYINTTKGVKSLKFLKDFVKLDSVAEEWMYDNVDGDINLNYLYGKVDLNKEELLLDSLKGQAVIKDAKIRFNKDAKAVNTKKLTVNYKNDTLSFDLLNPIYNKSKLYGSRVYINNLTSLQKGEVHVDLKSDSMLNDDVLGILKAFKINLPLKQIDGKLDSVLKMNIPYLAKRKMDVDGIFKLKNANLQLNDFKFLAKDATVILKDSDVFIKNSHMLYNDMLDTNLKLSINTKNLTAKGEAKVNSFEIKGEKESIVRIKDFETPLKIDFKNEAKINLDSLKTLLYINKKSIDIDIKDLNLIYPHSKLLQTTTIKDGDLKIKYIDDENILFDINAKNLDFPFEQDGKKVTQLEAQGILTGDTTTIKTKDSKVEVLIKKDKHTLLKLKDTDLSLLNRKQGEAKTLPNIDIELLNSKVIIDEKHKYKTSWANISIKNSKINFEGKALDLDLPISKGSKKITDLEVEGSYSNKVLNLTTKDKKLKLKYELPIEKITMGVQGYDVLYDTEEKNDEESIISYDITGKNSNIIINKKYIAKADSYKFIFEKEKTVVDLIYKKTKFEYYEDILGNITVNAKNMNDEFLNSLISKNLIEGGNVDLSASGKNKIINGKATIKNSKIVDLAILNNLLIFINTSPALINPLLAIPSVVDMAANDGFNLNGYKVIDGEIDFSYDLNSRFLNMNKIFTKGNGIDFDGYSLIDFKTSKIDSRLKLIFLKSYSKIVGAIPVLNYVLLGDKKRVDTEVIIYGTLQEPEYKTALAEEGVKAPLNLLKRIITSPIKIIESLEDNSDKKDKQKLDNKKIQEKNEEKILNNEKKE